MKKISILIVLLFACTIHVAKSSNPPKAEPIVIGSRISYPDGMTNIGDKVAFLLRAKQLNLLLHNSTGKWLRDGLTKDEYDNGIIANTLNGKTSKKFKVPDRIKESVNSGIFKSKISKPEWDAIIADDFFVNLRDIEGAFSTLMDSLMKDTKYDSLITL